MKVQMHKLFEYLLETTGEKPEAFIGFSLASPPRLGDFLDDLDPELPLDWSNQSFQGMDALRSHILRQADLCDVCTVDDVLVTAGAAEANYLAIMQLVQPGDEIVLESPGWPQAPVLARAIGATVKTVDRREDEGWALDVGRLTELITDRTRLVFLTNPNNPTGSLLSGSELRAITECADRVGAHVLVDEVYAGLEWQGPRMPSVAGLSENAITTGSVSKALGLQGLRLGWMICRNAGVIRDAVILRENSSEIMNVMGEMIAEIALRPDRYQTALANARREGLDNLSRLDAFIARRPELSWHRPEAGLIGLCRLDLDCDGEAFARRLLAPPYRTFLIPGSAYGQPHHIRVGVGGGEAARLDDGLERLEQCLDDIGG